MNKNCRIIYKRLEEKLKKNEFINLNHRLVNSKDDLIQIADIFKSNAYETLRIIYMNKNRLAGYESITSRAPNYVRVYEKYNKGKSKCERCVFKMKDRMKRLGADGYYLVHNHVSGDTKVSKSDRVATNYFVKHMDGFLGHLIISNERYSWLEKGEDGELKIYEEVPLNDKKIKKKEAEIKKSPIDNVKIKSREDLIGFINMIKSEKECSSAILTDCKGKVNMVVDVPNSFLNMKFDQVKGYFRNLARTCGVTRVFFATSSKDAFLRAKEHQFNGTFKDCILYQTDGNRIFVYERSDITVKTELFDEDISLNFLEDADEYGNDSNKLRILYKKVGEEPKELEIDNTLEAKQKLVGGYIEVVPYDDALIICNEEGKMLNLRPNVVFDYDYIAGDFFVVGDDYERGDFKSLTDEEVKKYKKDLNERSFKYITPKEDRSYPSKEEIIK